MSDDERAGTPVTSSSETNRPLQPAELFALFGELRPDLLRLLQRRTGNRESAADLVQDLFVRLTSVTAILPDRQQARAYIFRMAANLAIDRARTETRRAEIMSGAELLFEDAGPSPEAVAVTRDQIRQVDKALAELPPKCREVLIMARLHGLSHREIAERLGVSVSLVEKYLLRALRHCRDRLGGEFPA